MYSVYLISPIRIGEAFISKKKKMNNGLISGVNSIFTAAMLGEKKPILTIYEYQKEPTHKWRWHLKVSADIIAASSQGYASRQHCIENLKKLGGYIAELDKEGKIA